MAILVASMEAAKAELMNSKLLHYIIAAKSDIIAFTDGSAQ